MAGWLRRQEEVERTVRGQLAVFWTSGWNRERHTASKSMRDVAALPFALPGCASICVAVLAAGMLSTVCRAVIQHLSHATTARRWVHATSASNPQPENSMCHGVVQALAIPTPALQAPSMHACRLLCAPTLSFPYNLMHLINTGTEGTKMPHD